MFASLDERPSLKARLKRLLLPIAVAFLMNIPLEVDLHTAVKRHDYDLQHFEFAIFSYRSDYRVVFRCADEDGACQ